MKILQRAKELADKGADLFATPAFLLFLKNTITESDFASDKNVLHQFALLDDYDVFTSVKVWCYHDDFILSTLCTNLIDRKLYKIKIQKERIDSKELANAQHKAVSLFNIENQHSHYFAFEGEEDLSSPFS